jgi:DNA-binding transcriptional regulator YiaG
MCDADPLLPDGCCTVYTLSVCLWLSREAESMRAIKPDEIKRIREGLGMSQAEFAAAFHLNLRSLQKWEQEGIPAGPTAILFWLLSKMPRQALKALKDF